MANPGDQILKKLTTSRLFLQFPSDAAGVWRDMGNEEDYKNDPKIQRKEHMASGAGVKRTDLSLAAEITPKWSFTVDEFGVDLEALLLLGTQGADSVQAGGNIVGEQITVNSLQGRTYFLANEGASAIVVKVGAAVYMQGVDYQLDNPLISGASGSGAITILNGGGIVNGSTVAVTYTAAAVTNHTFTAMTQLLQLCKAKVVEYDQFSTVPRCTTTYSGQVYVTNWGDNKADYTKVVIEVLAYGQPTISRRAD
jgi:hypothetical protein